MSMMIPADNVILGLKQCRQELIDQLSKLDRTREGIEENIEAIERAMSVVQPIKAAMGLPKPSAQAMKPAPVEKKIPRGQLTAMVKEALGVFGSSTSAEIAVSIDVDPKKVCGCLAGLRRSGVVGISKVPGEPAQWFLAGQTAE